MTGKKDDSYCPHAEVRNNFTWCEKHKLYPSVLYCHRCPDLPDKNNNPKKEKKKKITKLSEW